MSLGVGHLFVQPMIDRKPLKTHSIRFVDTISIKHTTKYYISFYIGNDWICFSKKYSVSYTYNLVLKKERKKTVIYLFIPVLCLRNGNSGLYSIMHFTTMTLNV